MEKSKAFTLAFWAFCVLSSKNIIIYNEETLVALSFFAFIFFMFYYYGHTIQESLNERGAVIKLELQNVGGGRLHSLGQLLKEHQKLSALNKECSSITRFTTRELLAAIQQGSMVLNTLFSQQIEQKLKTLSLSKSAIQQKLQQFMANDFSTLVHVHFQGSKKENQNMSVNPQLFEDALQLVSTR